MLQQTQVKTVIPYFNNFIKKIPNLLILSRTNKKVILKLWEGLGYYRRVKNLHKTSKILIEKYNGRLPKQFKEIKDKYKAVIGLPIFIFLAIWFRGTIVSDLIIIVSFLSFVFMFVFIIYLKFFKKK